MKNPSLNNNDNELSSLLSAHHQQALSQSSIQFGFSVFSAFIGLVFIFIMLAINSSTNMQWYQYILQTLPGTIIETVSVLFFNQARETRERATKFFKELNFQQQISRSVSIAESIDDETIKSNVKSQIALHIIGINNDAPKDD